MRLADVLAGSPLDEVQVVVVAGPLPPQRSVLELEPCDPPVVVAVAAAGHEVASAGFAHTQVHELVVLLAHLVDRIADGDDRRQEGDRDDGGCNKSFPAPYPGRGR